MRLRIFPINSNNLLLLLLPWTPADQSPSPIQWLGGARIAATMATIRGLALIVEWRSLESVWPMAQSGRARVWGIWAITLDRALFRSVRTLRDRRKIRQTTAPAPEMDTRPRISFPDRLLVVASERKVRFWFRETMECVFRIDEMNGFINDGCCIFVACCMKIGF